MMYIWFVVMLILIYIEIATPAMISIWFVISAFLTMLLSIFVPNILIQILFFGLGGVALYYATIKTINKRIYGEERVNDVIERIVGKKGVVNNMIEPGIEGEVTIDGKVWKARAIEKILVSEIVKVIDINDNILMVKKEF